MTPHTLRLRAACIAAATVLFAGSAHAANLEAGPDAPAWARLGAAALLYLHIGGGTVGMVSGVVVLSARKGGRLHRTAGKVFFAAMLVTYAIGAGVAPFLTEGQRPNFIAGVMALSLLISGWMAARRPEVTAGPPRIGGLAVALIITAAGVYFMHLGALSPTGTIDGSPPQAFILFTFAGTLAAAGELNVILRRRIAGAARVARHLWRLCFSLFIAAGSFFLGQMQFQPAWMRESVIPYAAAFAPLLAMAFWLVQIRFDRRYRRTVVTQAPNLR